MCSVCGLEAHSEGDLELFMKSVSAKHGRSNMCKSCSAEIAGKYYWDNWERLKENRYKNRDKRNALRRARRKLRVHD